MHRTWTGLVSCIFATIVGGAALAETAQPAEQLPNVIIFFTDDHGYNDVGCFGSPLIETPRLNRMAKEGTRFTDFYVQPVCGVSRAALMTGCYPMRVAEVGNRKNGHPVLHTEEITMAEMLKTSGYATALIGKWHLAGGRTTQYDASRMPYCQAAVVLLVRTHDERRGGGGTV